MGELPQAASLTTDQGLELTGRVVGDLPERLQTCSLESLCGGESSDGHGAHEGLLVAHADHRDAGALTREGCKPWVSGQSGAQCAVLLHSAREELQDRLGLTEAEPIHREVQVCREAGHRDHGRAGVEGVLECAERREQRLGGARMRGELHMGEAGLQVSLASTAARRGSPRGRESRCATARGSPICGARSRRATR